MCSEHIFSRLDQAMMFSSLSEVNAFSTLGIFEFTMGLSGLNPIIS